MSLLADSQVTFVLTPFISPFPVRISHMGASESKPASTSDADWNYYKMLKDSAHKHYDEGTAAEGKGNFDLAYKKYCQAIEERMQCDAFWARNQGGGYVDGGHAHFTKQVVSARDRVDRKRNGNSKWGPPR